VERSTGYVMLLHLPDGYKPEQVRDALAAKIKTLPDSLRLLSVVKSFGPTVVTNVGPTFEALSGRCPGSGAREALLCALS
jgi:hypothetical protein